MHIIIIDKITKYIKLVDIKMSPLNISLWPVRALLYFASLQHQCPSLLEPCPCDNKHEEFETKDSWG